MRVRTLILVVAVSIGGLALSFAQARTAKPLDIYVIDVEGGNATLVVSPQGESLLSENVIRFGFYQTRWGKRRRYRCQTCEKTFCSNTGTPYYRLQHRRATFDQVASLSVEGLNKSAIARVERIGWNTVDRWLEKASDCGRRFNDQEITGFKAS